LVQARCWRASYFRPLQMRRLHVAAGMVLGTMPMLASARASMTPVTRVVQLLKGMGETIEIELTKEEDLYEAFVCWGKSVVEQKEETNKKAGSRIERLETYIDDLENGKIELTTERVDLEKEIAGLTADIDQAEALREKEEKDFDAAKTEMDQAVAALEKALESLRKGMGKDKSLLSMNANINSETVTETFAAHKQEIALLDKAVAIGAKVLSKGDEVFLRRILEGDVPTKDWKKLNRKATFKKKYEARSAKIESLLQKLLEDFSADLQEAKDKEDKGKKTHKKLMDAKKDQKDKADKALVDMTKENGARSLSKTDAKAELDALKEQVKDDTKHISDTKTSMDDKKTEWKDRKALRRGEIAAIAKAVSILHSDDARDLMKKSYASQGYLFLQEASSQIAERNAVAVLRQMAQKTHDQRLAGLAALAETAHFDKVLGAIDKMLGELKSEEGDELKKKETCESDRAEDTRSAIKTSREIDEISDTITGLEAKIEEITAEITEKNETIVKIEEQLADSKKIRDREHEDYLVSKKDDEDAAKLVGDAKEVLTQFYAENTFLETKVNSVQPVETTAGEAPPPPPPTWDAGYKGKKDESSGIVAILGMVKSDIESDLASAKKAEDDGKKAYDKIKADLEKEKGDLDSDISELDGQKANHEGDVVTNKKDRKGKKGEVKTVLKKLKDAESFCDYLLINYATRSENRKIEIDGLEKAKAILNGAEFEDKKGNLLQRPPLLRRVAAHAS